MTGNRDGWLIADSLGFLQLGLFDIHVFELTRFEDLAAFDTLDEFGVFFAGYDRDAGMLACLHRNTHVGGSRRAGSHRFRNASTGPSCPGKLFSPELAVFLAGWRRLLSLKLQNR